MRTMSIAAVAMLATAGVALGEPALYPVQDCNKAVTQYDLDMCAGANNAAADKALNDTYKELLARQPDQKSRMQLRDAERAWIVYRDKECASEVGPREGGGTIWPMEMSNCEETKTAARLRELKHNLECSESPDAC